MAGGQGTRLYPLSTAEKPKQFLDLLGVGKTLIQLTYERFKNCPPFRTSRYSPNLLLGTPLRAFLTPFGR